MNIKTPNKDNNNRHEGIIFQYKKASEIRITISNI